jgi:hypothetical protein
VKPPCFAASLFAVVMVVGATAHAGRRTLAFTPDAVQLAPGVLEIEQWVWSRAYVGDVPGASSGWIWFSPVYGMAERLEIALPWQLNTDKSATRLMSFGAEARYALFDPIDETLTFRPQLRLGWQQNFSHPDEGPNWSVPWLTMDFVGTVGDPRAQHISFDVGFTTDFKNTLGFHEHQLGLGAVTPFPLLEQLLVGAEYRHQITVGTNAVGDRRWFFLGPTAAYARGRLWMSFAFLVGVGDLAPRFLPRLALGMVL